MDSSQKIFQSSTTDPDFLSPYSDSDVYFTSNYTEFDGVNVTKNDVCMPHNLNDSLDSVLSILWSVFDKNCLRHSLPWTVVLTMAYLLILLVGIVGNSMVILVVTKRPQMRTVTNLFIMNLAVADLFVVVFCVPSTLLANVFTPWILGEFMCKAVAYVQGVSVCASGYSLAAISIDRWKVFFHALKRPHGISKYQALLVIFVIWVASLLLLIPWPVVFTVIISDSDGMSYCVETWRNPTHGKIYFVVINLLVCYCVPLILISVLNASIWCHVSQRQVPQHSASVTSIKNMHRKTRHGVRKMLGIVTLAFILSWLPLYILVTSVKFLNNLGDSETKVLEVLMPVAQLLGSWNSCINPVLYAFLNTKFREMFKSLLPSWMPFRENRKFGVILRHEVVNRNRRNGASSGRLTEIASNTRTTATNSPRRTSSGNSSRSSQSKKNAVLQNLQIPSKSKATSSVISPETTVIVEVVSSLAYKEEKMAAVIPSQTSIKTCSAVVTDI